MEVDENSTVTMPIRNMVMITIAILTVAAGYFEVDNRVAANEKDIAFILGEVRENSKEVDEIIILSNKNAVRIEMDENQCIAPYH